MNSADNHPPPLGLQPPQQQAQPQAQQQVSAGAGKLNAVKTKLAELTQSVKTASTAGKGALDNLQQSYTSARTYIANKTSNKSLLTKSEKTSKKNLGALTTSLDNFESEISRLKETIKGDRSETVLNQKIRQKNHEIETKLQSDIAAETAKTNLTPQEKDGNIALLTQNAATDKVTSEKTLIAENQTLKDNNLKELVNLRKDWAATNKELIKLKNSIQENPALKQSPELRKFNESLGKVNDMFGRVNKQLEGHHFHEFEKLKTEINTRRNHNTERKFIDNELTKLENLRNRAIADKDPGLANEIDNYLRGMSKSQFVKDQSMVHALKPQQVLTNTIDHLNEELLALKQRPTEQKNYLREQQLIAENNDHHNAMIRQVTQAKVYEMGPDFQFENPEARKVFVSVDKELAVLDRVMSSVKATAANDAGLRTDLSRLENTIVEKKRILLEEPLTPAGYRELLVDTRRIINAVRTIEKEALSMMEYKAPLIPITTETNLWQALTWTSQKRELQESFLLSYRNVYKPSDIATSSEQLFSEMNKEFTNVGTVPPHEAINKQNQLLKMAKEWLTDPMIHNNEAFTNPAVAAKLNELIKNGMESKSPLIASKAEELKAIYTLGKEAFAVRPPQTELDGALKFLSTKMETFSSNQAKHAGMVDSGEINKGETTRMATRNERARGIRPFDLVAEQNKVIADVKNWLRDPDNAKFFNHDRMNAEFNDFRDAMRNSGFPQIKMQVQELETLRPVSSDILTLAIPLEHLKSPLIEKLDSVAADELTPKERNELAIMIANDFKANDIKAFSQITTAELSNQNWLKGEGEKAPNIKALQDNTNHLSAFVDQQVLKHSGNPAKQSKMIDFFIEVEKQMLQETPVDPRQKNGPTLPISYQSAFAIDTVLNGVRISRLEVSTKHVKQWASFQKDQLLKNPPHFKELREAQKNNPKAIPLLNLTLGDAIKLGEAGINPDSVPVVGKVIGEIRKKQKQMSSLPPSWKPALEGQFLVKNLTEDQLWDLSYKGRPKTNR